MVEESIRNIQDVNATAQKTGDQLQGILGNANKVADFLEEIAASSQEQARAMGQINGGLDQIDQVTQSNTASAEESASASEELSGQAQQLKVMVSRFQLSGDAMEKAKARAATTEHHRPQGSFGTKPAAPSLLKKAAAGPVRPQAPAKDIILNDDFDTF
jgi:methyl-accepting chemotaxis protein